jgi:hypothetical protein
LSNQNPSSPKLQTFEKQIFMRKIIKVTIVVAAADGVVTTKCTFQNLAVSHSSITVVAAAPNVIAVRIVVVAWSVGISTRTVIAVATGIIVVVAIASVTIRVVVTVRAVLVKMVVPRLRACMLLVG